MKRYLTLFILFLSTVILSGCSLLPSSKKAALSVKATPKATIFLDGEHLGQTPYYNEKLKQGEYVLKIVPESSGEALSIWEGRLTLSPGILTVVDRELGLTQDSSSGEILSFEPLADKNDISMTVVTTPDGAVVNLDGEPRGFAPLSIDDLSEGDHILVITSPGYRERSIKTKTVKGHKLIASVQLARETVAIETEEEEEATKSAEASPKTSPKPSPTPSPGASPSPQASPKSSPTADIARPYAQVNNEVDGYVNCRSGPVRESDNLVTTLDHGDKFPFLDEQSGWYQVEYETDKQCWITGKYAEKYL